TLVLLIGGLVGLEVGVHLYIESDGNLGKESGGPAAEGPQWDERDLAEHLKKNGLPRLQLIRENRAFGSTYYVLDGGMTANDIEMQSDPIRGSGARFFVSGVIRVSGYSSVAESAKHLRTVGADQLQ